MSAKTKIVVLHMKELIYTGIFAALGILFIVLLIVMFLPDKEDAPSPDTSMEESADDSTATAASGSIYIPGIYTTELVLGGQSVDVEVIVNKSSISSIQLVNLNDAVTTMYPLLQPTFDSICAQVYETQSLEQVTYTAESKYTSLVLLQAIKNSLDKASAENQPAESKNSDSDVSPTKITD